MGESLPVDPEPNPQREQVVGFSPLTPGSVFHSAYEIVRCLGAGGMGAIYEVLQLSTRRRRVLKTMLPSLLTDVDMRARFGLEATITAEIESEHIVEVFDAGVDEAMGLPFLVMEYLRGENLSRLLQQKRVFSASEVVLMLHQASLALERTHAQGVVHRDLKPDNLFLTRRDDGSPRLKILDFGIAKIVADSKNLNTTRSFGTPLYMSPEQIRGDGTIDYRADLYSLGQVAYTLLVGREYWEREAAESSGLYAILIKVVEGRREPASTRAALHGVTLPSRFDAWFSRATHPSAEERFDSALSLVDALAEALGVPSPNPPEQASGRDSASSSQSDRLATPRTPSATEQPSMTLSGVCDTGPSASAGQPRPTQVQRWQQSKLKVLALTLVGAVLLFGASRWGGWGRPPLGPERSALGQSGRANSGAVSLPPMAVRSPLSVATDPGADTMKWVASTGTTTAPVAGAPSHGRMSSGAIRAERRTQRSTKSDRNMQRTASTGSDPSDVR